MIYLSIDEQYLAMIEPDFIERAAQATIQHQEISTDSSLSIVVTDDPQLHLLNQQFVGVDAPTDVLSFPAGYMDPDTNSFYLGDILISYPRAREQAEQAGHSVDAELQLLVVHGILHLAGHDHADDQDKVEMWSAQAEILSILGVDLRNPPE
jgi:probable rRNA maturation factor